MIVKGTGPILIHVNTDRITDTATSPDVEKGFSFRYKISSYRR